MPTPTDVDFCLTEKELLEAQKMTKEEDFPARRNGTD